MNMGVRTITNGGDFAPGYAAPPGDTLADVLEERGMTQTELARRLGVSLKHVNQVIKGAASISAELALGLEKVLGVSAAFWLNRESLYQADIARMEERRALERAVGWSQRFPVAEMKKRRLLPSRATGVELVSALLQFFGIASTEQWSDPRVAFRKSLKFESDPYALSAWLRLGELEAESVETEPFDSAEFVAALEGARRLTRLQVRDWHPRLVETCANAGVAVVVVDTFQGARANGATRWLSPTKALVQLSLRYRWEDVFWFSFFHEAGHVLLHRKKDVFVELPTSKLRSGTGSDERRLEQEADRFSSRTLIPPKYDHILSRLSLSQVPAFAEQLNIAPAIVIGLLQHEGLLPHTHGNGLRRRLAFVDG
jgi:HTH-type transcriptional regulator / antitoxin HigA